MPKGRGASRCVESPLDRDTHGLYARVHLVVVLCIDGVAVTRGATHRGMPYDIVPSRVPENATVCASTDGYVTYRVGGHRVLKRWTDGSQEEFAESDGALRRLVWPNDYEAVYDGPPGNEHKMCARWAFGLEISFEGTTPGEERKVRADWRQYDDEASGGKYTNYPGVNGIELFSGRANDERKHALQGWFEDMWFQADFEGPAGEERKVSCLWEDGSVELFAASRGSEALLSHTANVERRDDEGRHVGDFSVTTHFAGAAGCEKPVRVVKSDGSCDIPRFFHGSETWTAPSQRLQLAMRNRVANELPASRSQSSGSPSRRSHNAACTRVPQDRPSVTTATRSSCRSQTPQRLPPPSQQRKRARRMSPTRLPRHLGASQNPGRRGRASPSRSAPDS